MPRPPESLPADLRCERERRISRRMALLALATVALAFSALFRAAPGPAPRTPFRSPPPLGVASEKDFASHTPAADPRELNNPAVCALPTRIGFTHRLATAVPSSDPANGTGAGDVPRLPPAPEGAPQAETAASDAPLFRSPLPVPFPAPAVRPAPESIALPPEWEGKTDFPEKALALLATPASAEEARTLPCATFRLVFDAEGRLLAPLALSPASAASAALAAALGGAKLLDGTAPRAGNVRFRLRPSAPTPPAAAPAAP